MFVSLSAFSFLFMQFHLSVHILCSPYLLINGGLLVFANDFNCNAGDQG